MILKEKTELSTFLTPVSISQIQEKQKIFVYEFNPFIEENAAQLLIKCQAF